MIFFGPTWFLLLPALIFAMYAQGKVKSAYKKYSKVVTSTGYSGAQAARKVLDENGLKNIEIELTGGSLTDHYDPRKRVLRLSEGVHSGRSLASVGIAAHEAGHALQHATEYFPLHIRNGIFPVASFGSTLAFPLFFMGFLFNTGLLMDVGIIVFSAAVAFQIITLPVEFNASKRAIQSLRQGSIITEAEVDSTRSVLSAAALTYVAATAMAVLQLLRLILLRGARD